MQIPLALSSEEVSASEVNSQRLVNWYAQTGGKKGTYISPTPGLEQFDLNSEANQGVRALYTTSSGRLFSIIDKFIYEYVSGSPILRGSLITGSLPTTYSTTGQCVMIDNGDNLSGGGLGDQMLISDGTYGWLYHLSLNVVAPPVDYPGGFPVYQNGYFLTNQPGTDKFYSSDLFDGDAWTNFTRADGSPGNIIRLIRNGGEVWVLKANSCEAWYNSGSSGVPFDRINGSEKEIGLLNENAVVQTGTGIYFIGKSIEGSGQIYVIEQLGIRKISTETVEESIFNMTDSSDVWTWSYQQGSHTFVIFTFPTDNKTWCYELETGLWAERMKWNATTGQEEAHLVGNQAFFDGENYVGSHKENIIYKLKPDVYTDNGDPIVRICETPTIHADRQRVFFKDLKVDLERGIGLISGQGSDPELMMEMSNDGGKTWFGERWESAGGQGEYKKRVIWNRLGSAWSRSFRFKVSDPVAWTLIAAYSRTEVGK